MPGLFDRLQSEIDRREAVESFSPIDLLALPPDVRAIVQALMRRGNATAAEVGESCGLSESEALALLDALVEKGILARVETPGEAGPPRWRTNLGRRRARAVPSGIWSRLADSTREPDEPADPGAGAPPDGGAR